MTTVNTYLTFKGNCEAAFDFYKSAFGGEFTYLGRFGEMPQDDPNCKVDEAIQATEAHILQSRKKKKKITLQMLDSSQFY